MEGGKRKEFDPILADGNPAWAQICKPLIETLALKPMSMNEIEIWAHSNSYTNSQIIQMLAWCENRKKLYYLDSKWFLAYKL